MVLFESCDHGGGSFLLEKFIINPIQSVRNRRFALGKVENGSQFYANLVLDVIFFAKICSKKLCSA